MMSRSICINCSGKGFLSGLIGSSKCSNCAGVGMIEEQNNMEKKYYATRSAIDYPPILKTEEEAIAEAHKKMHQNPNLTQYYVVKVVKIIRKPLPLFEVVDA